MHSFVRGELSFGLGFSWGCHFLWKANTAKLLFLRATVILGLQTITEVVPGHFHAPCFHWFWCVSMM